ncbi:MAG: adenylyltransferase/cytidyltransferase family protein [Candidatus Saccharimonadales bacterium]
MIITINDLPIIRARHADKLIVFGGGVYDLVHWGHVEGIAFRRSLGDIYVCGVVSDERAKQRKRLPMRTESDRLAVINSFKDVDYALIMPMPKPSLTPTLQVIEKLKPDVYVEYIENQDYWSAEDRERMASLGTRLIFDTQPKRNSTTNIISRLKV